MWYVSNAFLSLSEYSSSTGISPKLNSFLGSNQYLIWGSLHPSVTISPFLKEPWHWFQRPMVYQSLISPADLPNASANLARSLFSIFVFNWDASTWNRNVNYLSLRGGGNGSRELVRSKLTLMNQIFWRVSVLYLSPKKTRTRQIKAPTPRRYGRNIQAHLPALPILNAILWWNFGF